MGHNPGKISLRLFLVVPFVAQLVGTVTLVGYISYRNGQAAVHELASQLRHELSDRIHQQLQNYVGTPFLINQTNATFFAKGNIDLTNPSDSDSFLQQTTTFPATNLIYCGRESDGAFMGVGWGNDRQIRELQVQYSNPATRYLFHYQAIDRNGRVLRSWQAIDRPYDPRVRPWYRVAKQKTRATWSDIYLDFDALEPVITASQPVYDQSGKTLLGVCATDFLLSIELNTFLSQLTIGRSGETFILERSGLLVSSSTSMEEDLLIGTGERAQRLPATQSKNSLVRATTQFLIKRFGQLQQIESEQQLSFDRDGIQFVQVLPFKDERGLDWLIVVVVPEADFMEKIHNSRQTTILLCGISLLVAIGTGIVTAQWITKPIQRLNDAAKRIAKGEWEQAIGSKRTDEVGELAQSFNNMAKQLKTIFDHTEELNQELSTSRDQFRQILEALPIGILVLYQDDRDTYTASEQKLIVSSGAAPRAAPLETVGFCSDKLYLNQTGRELLGAQMFPSVPLDQITSAYQIYRVGTNAIYPVEELPLIQALQGEASHADDLEVRYGEQITILGSWATTVLDAQGQVMYAISIFQDITARKQAEAALREQEAQFRRIAESVPGVIYRYIVHPDGSSNFTYISPRCRELFELEADQIIQESIILWSIVHPDDVVTLKERIASSQQTLQPLFIDYRIITASTQLKWIEILCHPAVLPNGDVVWDGIAMDITDRKQSAQLLEEYKQNLERQVKERTVALEYEIAERKQVEAILLEQEAYLSTVLDNIGACISIKTLNGVYTYVNHRCVELFGAPKEDIIGADDFQFFSTETAEIIRANDQQVIETGTILRQHEMNVLSHTGESCYYLSIKVPLRDEEDQVYALCSILTDITELKQTEAALRWSEAQNRAIVSAIPDLIFSVRADGVFLGYSRTNRFHDLVQEVDDPVGRSIVEMLPIDVAQRHLHHIQQALATGELQSYEQEIWINQTLQYEEVRVMPTGDDRVLFIVRDISDRKQAEQALQKAKEAAEAANRAKSAFLAGMSHELRTPLNAILGFAQIMRRDATLSPEYQRQLEIINRSGEHLLDLINSILDLSKIEAGYLELVESSFDLSNLVQTVGAMLHGRAIAKGIELQIELDPDLPEFVKTDPGKLRQVLINLIGNAIKFTDRGGVTLRVQGGEPANQSDSLEPDGLHPEISLQFEVQDTGVGIEPQDLQRIFEAFEQTSSGKKLTEGTGLGLTLSRKFVDLMGGTLSVSSSPGKGSQFAFAIPVQVTDTAYHQSLQGDRLMIELVPGQPTYQVLVVDDQTENRELLLQLLKPMGFSLQLASNGEEAIALWQQWRPHLILMDIRMPVLNGLEATQQIRAQEQSLALSPVPIIALSASVFQNDHDQAVNAGCDDFLKKPFQINELLDKIASHLNLQYTYMNPLAEGFMDVHSGKTSLDSLCLSLLPLLPQDWIEQLHQATASGDDVQIQHLLDQLPEQYLELGEGLRDLARRFQFDRILSLLEQKSYDCD